MVTWVRQGKALPGGCWCGGEGGVCAFVCCYGCAVASAGHNSEAGVRVRTRWGMLPRVEPKEVVCIRLLCVKSGGGGGERKVGVVSSWI